MAKSQDRGGIRRLPSTPLGTPEEPRSLMPDVPRGPRRWWDLPPVKPGETGLDLASCAFAQLTHLLSQSETRRWFMALNATLYHGGAVEDFAAAYNGLAPVLMWGGGTLTGGPMHNIVRSAVDTVASRLAMSKPKATAVSSNGTWEERLKCEGLTEFSSGLKEQTGFYDKLLRLDVDAAIFGDAFLKQSIRDGKLCSDRKLAPNIIIDEREGYYGDPRHMFERAMETRERLAILFPEGAKVAEKTEPTASADFFTPPADDPYSTVVEYAEAWVLPVAPGTEGPGSAGRHLVFTRAGVLLDEEWKRSDFPFVPNGGFQPTGGWRSESFVSGLRNGQLKTNRLDVVIDETIRRMSVGRWMVQNGSNLVVEHLNNEIGAIVRVDGPFPQKDASNAVPQEVLEERSFELQQQPAMQGVSPLAASGEVPAGLRSGEALKVHIDIQTQRFAPLEMRRAQFAVEHAKSGIALVRDYVRQGKSYKVWTLGKFDQAKVIDFASIDLDTDAYRIQISATNFMADSPEDQMDQGLSLAQAGVLDQVEMVDLINFQDLRSITTMKTAGLRFIKWLLYKMERDETFYMPPEPSFDLVHGLPYVRGARQQLIMDGAPPAIILKFLRWQLAAEALMQPPPPAPAPPTAPVPLGQPAPPPVSQMMPFRAQ